ncbi:MAG: PAS domain S-box protein [Clostridiales bacterium]|jgi:diguanylate cyclase (GGDEF)-like protein/PAS domain S-box-containing protein|nr:PAS domain S-box protein [Clostridiales bacterium]
MNQIETKDMLEFLEHAPTTIFLVDEEANILYCNHHAVTSFGIKSKSSFGSLFFSRFSTKFQSNIVAKDFMTIQVEKAMLQGMVRFSWTVRRDFHESPASIRLVRVEFEGKPCCIAYLTEFSSDGGAFFDEPMGGRFLDEKAWSILDSMPLVWAFVDQDINCLDCNVANLQLYGARDKQEFFARFHEIFPEYQPDGTVTAERARYYIDRALNEGKVIAEFILRTLQGESIPMELTIVRVGLENRFILSVFARDLREQKALEAHKALEEARLQAILENIPTAIHLWSADNKMLFCNDKMADIVGFTDTEEYREKFFDIFPDTQPNGRNSHEYDLELLNKVLETGRPIIFEWELIDKNGGILPVERSLFRINYGDDYAALEFCRDLREEHAREEILRKEAERFKLFFDTVPMACTFWNEGHELIMCNFASPRLFGLNSTAEFIERFGELSPPVQPCGNSSEIKFAMYLEAAFEGGYCEFDWIYQNPKTGEAIPTVMSLTRTEFEGRPGLIGLAIDQRAHFEKEELLKKEAERFRGFFDHLPIPVAFWDEDREMTMCNNASPRLLGLSSTQEYIERFNELSPDWQPDGVKSSIKIMQTVEQAFEKGYLEFDWVHINPNTGELIPVIVSLTRTEFGGRPGLVTLTLDQREHYAKEELIRNESERFKTFLDNAPIICTFWNDEPRISMVNDFAVQTFGFSSKEEYLDNFYKISPEFQPCGMSSEKKALMYVRRAFQTGYEEFEWMHQTVAGEEVPTFVNLILTEFEGRRGLMSFATDERKTLEREALLKQESDRFDTLFSLVPAVCTFWSDRDTLSMANTSAALLFGLATPQEYLDRFYELSPEIQPDGTPSSVKAHQYNTEAFERGHAVFEWMHQKPDGEPIPTVVALTRVFLGGKYGLIGFTHDMRIQKAHDEEYQLQIERLNTVFDHLPLAIHVWNTRGELVFTNNVLAEMFNFDRNKDYLDELYKIFPETQPCGKNSVDLNMELIDITFAEGYCEVVWEALDAAGRPAPLECVLVRINYGGVDAVLEVVRDIKADLEREAEHQIQIDRLNAILGHMPLAAQIWDENYNVIFANSAMLEISNVSVDSDLSILSGDIFPEFQPDGRPSTEVSDEGVSIAFERGFYKTEWMGVDVDGGGIPLECTLYRINYGGETAVVEFLRDLREEKARAAEQQQQIDRLNTILEFLPLAVEIWDEDYEIIFVNRQMLEITGFNSMDDYDRDLRRVFPENQPDGADSMETSRASIEKAFKEGFNKLEWVGLNSEGNPIYFECTLYRINYGGQTAVLEFCRDLTEEKAREAEQQVQIDRLNVILEHMPTAVQVWDKDLNVIFANSKMIEISGFDNFEEYIENLEMHLPEFQADGSLSTELNDDIVMQTFATGFQKMEFESVHVKTKELIPLECILYRINYAGQDAVLEFCRDLREDRVREAEHQVQIDRLNAILDNMPIATQIWDKSFDILFANRYIIDTLGFDDVEHYARDFRKSWPESQSEGGNSIEISYDVIVETFESGFEKLNYECVNIKTGELIPVECMLYRINYGGEIVVLEFYRDLREERAREAEHQVQIDRLNAILGNIPVATQIWDQNSNILFANRYIIDIMGYDDFEHYSRDIYKSWPESQPEGDNSIGLNDSAIDETFKLGYQKLNFECVNIKTGELIPLECVMYRINYGGETAVLEFCRDLREERALIAEYEMNLDRLNTILTNIPIAMQIWDKTHKPVFANQVMATTMGFETVDNFLEQILEQYPNMQSGGEDSRDVGYLAIEEAFKAGFSTTRWSTEDEAVALECTLIRINYDGEEAVLEICRDMSEELKEQARQREVQEKLSLFLNHMPIPAAIMDMELNIIDTNLASAELFGYNNKEDYMADFRKAWPEYQPDGTETITLFESIMYGVLEIGEIVFEVMLQTKDGTPLPGHITVITTEFSGERVLMVFFQDMRLNHAIAEENRLMKERLRAMLDASPNCCFITNPAGEVLDCNAVALTFFEVSNLSELNAHMRNLHGERQMDGTTTTRDIIAGRIDSIFTNSENSFEWIFRNTKGEVIPTQVSTHSMNLGGENVAIVYAKDLREHYRYVDEVKRSQEIVQAMVNLSPIVCIVLDEIRGVLECNDMALQFFGVSSKDELNFSHDNFCPPGRCGNTECAGMTKEIIKKNLMGEGSDFKRNCRLMVDGEVVPVELSGRRVPIGDRSCLVIYIGDMRESVRLEDERQQNYGRIVAMLNSSPLGGFVVDQNHEIVISNRSARLLLGIAVNDRISDYGGVFAFCPEFQPDGRPSKEKLAEFLDDTLHFNTGIDFEWMWATLRGDNIPTQVSLEIVELEGKNHVIAHMQDLRQLKRLAVAAETLEKMAYSDALTGVYNRRYLQDEAIRTFANCLERNEPFSLIMIDVDDFKPVNDTYGHSAGDEVLKILSARIQSVLRNNDVVIRYGGEEFLVLMPNTLIEDGKKIACRIKENIAKSIFSTSEGEIPITVSIGIATLDEGANKASTEETLQTIITNADKAMYHSKKIGKNKVLKFEDGVVEAVEC